MSETERRDPIVGICTRLPEVAHEGDLGQLCFAVRGRKVVYYLDDHGDVRKLSRRYR
jgi:hypothetical protein